MDPAILINTLVTSISTALVLLIPVLVAAWLQIRASRRAEASTTVAIAAVKKDVGEVKGEVVILKEQTNHKLDALLVTTDAAARAEGNIAGRKEQRAEARQDAPAASSQPAPNDAVKIDDVVKIAAVETTNEPARGT